MFGLDRLQRLIINANRDGNMMIISKETIIPYHHFTESEAKDDFEKVAYFQREEIFKELRTEFPDHIVLECQTNYLKTELGTLVTTNVKYLGE
jgi:hypothetical protein